MKLEVGKKYNINTQSDNPHIFAGDLKNYEYAGNHPLLFVNNKGYLDQFREEITQDIIEHKKPTKNSCEYYLYYDPLVNNQDNVINKLTGLCVLYGKEEKITSSLPAKKFRITIEEISE